MREGYLKCPHKPFDKLGVRDQLDTIKNMHLHISGHKCNRFSTERMQIHTYATSGISQGSFGSELRAEYLSTEGKGAGRLLK